MFDRPSSTTPTPCGIGNLILIWGDASALGVGIASILAAITDGPAIWLGLFTMAAGGWWLFVRRYYV